jgi:hypothetical protein
MSYKAFAVFSAGYFAAAGLLLTVAFTFSSSPGAAHIIAQARKDVAEVRFAREEAARRMVARRSSPLLLATAKASSR